MEQQEAIQKFFEQNPDAQTVYLPVNKEQKTFDFAPLIDGKINGQTISVEIWITNCNACNSLEKECHGHIITIFDQYCHSLTHNCTNWNREFTLQELKDLNYLPHIKFVVDNPKIYLEKCAVAKAVGKENVVQDYDYSYL